MGTKLSELQYPHPGTMVGLSRAPWDSACTGKYCHHTHSYRQAAMGVLISCDYN